MGASGYLTRSSGPRKLSVDTTRRWGILARVATDPGWYIDPEGETKLRFWDGEGWTRLTASGKWRARRRNRLTGYPTSKPGWYLDPEGEAAFRYWDGMNWTLFLASSRHQVERFRFAVCHLDSPPGWYLDPKGQSPFRYWDGTRWTNLVASQVGNVGSSPASPGHVTTPALHVNNSRKKTTLGSGLLDWFIADEKTPGDAPQSAFGSLLFLIALGYIALSGC